MQFNTNLSLYLRIRRKNTYIHPQQCNLSLFLLNSGKDRQPDLHPNTNRKNTGMHQPGFWGNNGYLYIIYI